jgi:hypothetical protein
MCTLVLVASANIIVAPGDGEQPKHSGLNDINN